MSPSTSRQIDWEVINRSTIGLGPARAADSDQNGSVDLARIQVAFTTLKTEFAKAAAPLRRSMSIIVPLMLVAFGVAVAAGFVLPLVPWGAATAGAGNQQSVAPVTHIQPVEGRHPTFKHEDVMSRELEL